MTERIEKVLRSYAETDGNLGVILSGAKGIGKSLFAKLITARAVTDGLPVIMVNQYEPGLPQFLASIEQRCLVLFDEFDKNFYAHGGASVDFKTSSPHLHLPIADALA